MQDKDASAVTAGFLNADWSPQNLPEGARTTNVSLRTKDGAASTGSLYEPANATDTVVCIMHPREFLACHYLVPPVVAAGYAAWTQGARSVGNDIKLEHELTLHEVAAGVGHLLSLGYKKIVLLGNSGGAGLYSMYVQQSNKSPEDRIKATPAGRPTGLDELAMPKVDGFIMVAPHPGQGTLLQNCIDPSVMDEDDPFSTNEALNPFSPDNGYGGRNGVKYHAEFIQSYKAAQIARVKRIDSIARELLARKKAAKQKVKELGEAAPKKVVWEANQNPIITVWRTDADLRCFDLSIDPSDRKYGSLWGKNPFVSNLGAVGFGRLCTPESWLSTWSGQTSNATLVKTAKDIDQPVLLIEYTGDQACFPEDVKKIYDDLASKDKQHIKIRGDHHGRPLEQHEEAGRYIAGKQITEWLRARF